MDAFLQSLKKEVAGSKRKHEGKKRQKQENHEKKQGNGSGSKKKKSGKGRKDTENNEGGSFTSNRKPVNGAGGNVGGEREGHRRKKQRRDGDDGVPEYERLEQQLEAILGVC